MEEDADIVEVLRHFADDRNAGYTTLASDVLTNAADEIERLRALITEWADAEAEWYAIDECDRYDDHYYCGPRVHHAGQALRKAVGR